MAAASCLPVNGQKYFLIHFDEQQIVRKEEVVEGNFDNNADEFVDEVEYNVDDVQEDWQKDEQEKVGLDVKQPEEEK